MFTYKKLAVLLLVVILGVPSVSAAASVASSLIQGKTPAEAMQILAEQIVALSGRVEQVENTQAQTQADISELQSNDAEIIEQQKAENEALRQQLETQQTQLEQQEQQREQDKQCEELSRAGSQFLPTKQPIKELYEALLRQNSVTLEAAYSEHVEGGGKVMSRDEFEAQWQDGKNNRDAKLAQLKPYYDEYVANCQ